MGLQPPPADGLEYRAPASDGRASHSPLVELRNVTKRYTLASGEPILAVDNISTTIADGEFICILGPSGHGKSTLLNLIAGLVQPSAGEVEFRGERVTGPAPERGVIFQRDTLFLWMRVADNVGYGLKARGVPRNEREAAVARLLDAVGLAKFARAWPKELSGGMRRRAAIAAVFANEPALLLMDEPFVGLDYARRAALHGVLLDLWTRAQNAVFFVTHDIDEALALASRILIVVNGKIVHEAQIDLPRPREGQALASPELNRVRSDVLKYLTGANAVAEAL